MSARFANAAARRSVARVVGTGAAAVTLAIVGYAAHGSAVEQRLGSPPRSTAPTGIAPTGTANPRGLDAALRHAFAVARQDAEAQGVDLHITSGWRSHAEQAQLFAAAVRKYGSARAASHWVLPPGHSAHERGEAIDVGPPDGAAWLDVHGVHYGLCRRYANEAWHFELLAPAIDQQCPPLEPYAHT